MSQTPPEAGAPVRFTCPNCCCSLIATLVSTGPAEAAATLAELVQQELRAWKRYQDVKALVFEMRLRPGSNLCATLLDDQVAAAERDWKKLNDQVAAARQ